MSEDFISNPVLLHNENGMAWVGGPLEVLPRLMDALDWADDVLILDEAEHLSACVVLMVPKRCANDEDCPSDGGDLDTHCGCWELSTGADACQFWQFDTKLQGEPKQ